MIKQSIIAVLLVAGCSLLLAGCGTGVQSNRELALQAMDLAGDNRAELEKVVDHYRTADPDPEKLAAAYFLIANMSGKYTLAARDTGACNALLRRIAAIPDPNGVDPYLSETGQLLDSIRAGDGLATVRQPDIETITAQLLITNIDAAVGQWRAAPWHTDYTFEAFCEWVLPYRLSAERPDDWRAAALASPREGEDSIRAQDSIFKLAVLLLNKTGMSYNLGMVKYPFPLTYSEMDMVRRGGCGQMADFATQIFRSRGIPAATELAPAWGNRSSSHAWNALILSGDSCKGIGYHDRGWLQMGGRLPKIYRQRFSIMRDDILYRQQESESIPDFFRECNMEDVTAQYGFPVSDVTVDHLKPAETQLVWLCVFDNRAWVPVAYAPYPGRGKAVFRDMGRGLLMGDNKATEYANGGAGILYLPGYYIGGRLAVAGDPVVLLEDGSQHTLGADMDRLQAITVGRKYPKYPQFEWADQGMVGGRFEGANRSDFGDAVALFDIREVQRRPFLRHPVASGGELFRYVRYVARDSTHGNVAEVQFYEDTTLLSGRAVGIPGNPHPRRGPQALFDGDMESFFWCDTVAGVWAGLDLGRGRRITSVAYSARTDDNDIRAGDTYELWYWRDGWQSLGRQRAAEWGELTWQGAPCGTLYLLRNVTRGVEQRPFTYKDGRLTWW